jgi:hypothetical protein
VAQPCNKRYYAINVSHDSEIGWPSNSVGTSQTFLNAIPCKRFHLQLGLTRLLKLGYECRAAMNTCVLLTQSSKHLAQHRHCVPPV